MKRLAWMLLLACLVGCKHTVVVVVHYPVTPGFTAKSITLGTKLETE